MRQKSSLESLNNPAKPLKSRNVLHRKTMTNAERLQTFQKAVSNMKQKDNKIGLRSPVAANKIDRNKEQKSIQALGNYYSNEAKQMK